MTVDGVPYLIAGWDNRISARISMRSAVMRVSDCGSRIYVLAQRSAFGDRSFVPAIAHDDRIWLFGGYRHNGNLSNVLGDVWSGSVSGGDIDWTLEAIDPDWEDREAQRVVKHDGWLYMMGGVTYFRPDLSETLGPDNPSHLRLFGDVWRSRDGIRWERVTASAPWGPRRDFGLTSVSGYMYLFGGVNDEQKRIFNDVWRSRDGRQWELVTDSAPWSPRAVMNHLAASDGSLWIIGGDELYSVEGSDSLRNRGLNDVWWSPDGLKWALVTREAPWSPRYGAFAFEMQCNGVTHIGLYGGQNDDWSSGRRSRTFFSDWWYSIDGKNWGRKNPAVFPVGHPTERSYRQPR